MSTSVEQYLRRSNIVEVASADLDEDTGAVKVVLRVLHEKPWIRLMADALRVAHGAESFGFEVHKAFYAQPGESGLDVRFAWMVMCWGELDAETEAKLGPILSRNLPTAPAFSLASVRKPQETQKRAPAAPRPAPPPVVADDDEPDPDLVVRQRSDGPHRVKFERHVEAGDESYDVYSIPLPHVRGPMYDGKRGNEVINMNSGRGRFKATVRGRGEDEFAPAKEGL